MRKLSTAVAVLAMLAALALPAVGQKQKGYDFALINAVPPGGPPAIGVDLIGYAYPAGINNRGDLLCASAVSTGGEGVFVWSKGLPSQLARSGDDAPGGGVFDYYGTVWMATLNDEGDAAFNFTLAGPDPTGTVGAYRYSRVTGQVTPVLVPGITPAPTGGVFQTFVMGMCLNNQGSLVFDAVVPTGHGIHVPGQDYPGVGAGIFVADKHGAIATAVAPGNPAPGGSTFDYVRMPWINDGGDIAFMGHLASEPLLGVGPEPAGPYAENVALYIRKANGAIARIVGWDDPRPGGGTWSRLNGPVMNSRGDVLFDDYQYRPEGPFPYNVASLFLYTKGKVVSVARPGDPMPGGGHLVNAGMMSYEYSLDSNGTVTFDGMLDTDSDEDGLNDTGLYVWSGGKVSLVARTGTVIPGVGTIAHLMPPWYVGLDMAVSGARANDRGQVFLMATLTDGTGVLLLATPRP